MEYGNLRDGRFKRLLAEADLVRASIEHDHPRLDRHARADWVLASGAPAGEPLPAEDGAGDGPGDTP